MTVIVVVMVVVVVIVITGIIILTVIAVLPQPRLQLLQPPLLARCEGEAVRREQRRLIEPHHAQAVAQEALLVTYVPVHAALLLQRPERPAGGVSRVRARQQQPRHQRHRL
jgi:hypothetical protein